MIYADIVIESGVRNLDRVFQYRVPDALEAKACVGARVKVPLGEGGRMMHGFIIGLSGKPSIAEDRIRDLASIEDAPPADRQLIQLAVWMHEHCDGTLSQALAAVQPVRRRVREKTRTVYTAPDQQKARAVLEESRHYKNRAARVRLLEAVLGRGFVTKEELSGSLHISAGTLKPLLESGVLAASSTQIVRGRHTYNMVTTEHAVLNAQQAKAAQEIKDAVSRCRSDWNTRDGVHLLYGITGSGKTEVYMEVMDYVLAQGRQVIVLIPEISLTPQTVARFRRRYGDRIAVMNSQLSDGEKYDQFMAARSGEASIMIGPRSALFAPFSDPGLIIVDEEHDGAYRSETTPKYDAREAAIERARLAHAAVILGSATPSLSSYKKASEGTYSLHTLTCRAKEGSALPQTEIADMREELKAGNRSIFSKALRGAMEETLQDGGQIMLFLNRRGFAGFVSCRSCGEVIRCPHCDVSLTAHSGGILKCHYCGFQMRMPQRCPVCGSPYIGKFGIGTQRVESIVRREFPDASVMRMDRDTASRKNAVADMVTSFSQGKADILIGTQMIVKGHDFENVMLVGILAADLSMHTGDYMSTERTFQLVTQAAGRAGRGSRPGRVVIQTYQPEHYCIQTAAAQDYEAFYRQEIQFRRLMHYPPAVSMLQILLEGLDDAQTEAAAGALHARLQRAGWRDPYLLGPVRAGIAKVRDRYRYVLYLRHTDEAVLLRCERDIQHYAAAARLDRDIYFNFDMNPISPV